MSKAIGASVVFVTCTCQNQAGAGRGEAERNAVGEAVPRADAVERSGARVGLPPGRRTRAQQRRARFQASAAAQHEVRRASLQGIAHEQVQDDVAQRQRAQGDVGFEFDAQARGAGPAGSGQERWDRSFDDEPGGLPGAAWEGASVPAPRDRRSLKGRKGLRNLHASHSRLPPRAWHRRFIEPIIF